MLRHSGQYIAASVLPCHRYISYARATYLTSRLINVRHEKCDGELNEGNALTMFQRIKKRLTLARADDVRFVTARFSRPRMRKNRVYTLIVTFLAILLCACEQ